MSLCSKVCRRDCVVQGLRVLLRFPWRRRRRLHDDARRPTDGGRAQVGGLSARGRRLLRLWAQDVPHGRQVLQYNKHHNIIKKNMRFCLFSHEINKKKNQHGVTFFFFYICLKTLLKIGCPGACWRSSECPSRGSTSSTTDQLRSRPDPEHHRLYHPIQMADNKNGNASTLPLLAQKQKRNFVHLELAHGMLYIVIRFFFVRMHHCTYTVVHLACNLYLVHKGK